MRLKTPIEVRHALDIRVRVKLAEIPVEMKSVIAVAEWEDDPKGFSRTQFIKETNLFIEKVYGFEPETYLLPVMFLADQMQTYIDASIGFVENGSEIVVDGKESVWLKLQSTALLNIIKINRLLGLTPASRMEALKPQILDINFHNQSPYT